MKRAEIIEKMRELVGRGRSTEYVLSKDECSELLDLIADEAIAASNNTGVAGVCNGYQIRENCANAIKERLK